MKALHKERASLEGKEVDFIFLHDNDFKDIIQGDYKEFVKENQQEEVEVALVGYPSFNSVLTASIDFPLSLVRDMYSGKTE